MVNWLSTQVSGLRQSPQACLKADTWSDMRVDDLCTKGVKIIICFM